MHGLKQQNAFGWTDISVHVSFICFYFYLNAMLPHFLENRFRSGQVDYFGVQKEVGWFMVFNATFNNISINISWWSE
jgi:hypothetical protein